MKFFIPGMSDQKAEEFYQAIKKFAVENTGPVNNRRIRSITYRDNGESLTATVGEREPCEGKETVMAILEGTTYLVCTMNRGVQGGIPYLVGGNEIWSIEDFEV